VVGFTTTVAECDARLLVRRLAATHWEVSAALLSVTAERSQQQLTQCHHGRGFLRLSDCFADLLQHSARGEVGTVACGSCGSHTAPDQLLALPCRHFHCMLCWGAHIEQTVTVNATNSGAELTCVMCPTAVSDDLVAAVASEEMLSLYATKCIRYSEAFINQCSTQLVTSLSLSLSLCASLVDRWLTPSPPAINH
jgi:transcription elongation factor Elf1